MTGQIIPPADTPCHAIASSVETPTHILSAAHARPLTVETPILIPVKEPGP